MIEDIIAHLSVKDRARFEGEMYLAAASVEHLGDEIDKVDRKNKKTSKSSQKLEKDVRNLGKRGFGNARKEVKKFGALAVFTERGLTSFAITIGTYLAPALLALGNSAGAAATGGALVAGGGLASLVVGLSGIFLIGKKVANQAQKVNTAWQQQQLAIEQYGENSDQAAKASAKLWAVIQQQGGMETFRIVKAWKALGDEFTRLTSTGRTALTGAFGDVLGGARRLMPTFGAITNQSAVAVGDVISRLSKTLSGEEIKGTLAVLGGTFKVIAGPLGRSVENVIIAVGRIFKATAPYVEDFADWIEKVTGNFRDWSSDQGKVNSFVGNLVDHFKSWVDLAGELGRTLHILFLGSKEEGKGFVEDLTDSLRKLNDWLDVQKDSGGMARFFQTFFDNVESLANWVNLVFTNQSEAIAQASDFAAKMGSAAANAFVNAFMGADWQGKLLIAFWVFSKLGVWRIIGGAIATRLIAGIAASAAADTAIATMSAAFALSMNSAIVAAATTLGPVAIVLAATLAIESITIGGKKLTAPGDNPIFKQADKMAHQDEGGILGFLNRNKPSTWFDRLRGHAEGGTIGLGRTGLVGERGPELATNTPLGTLITPIRRQLHSDTSGVSPMAISDHMPAVNINLVVDRSVLAKAVYRHNADIAARRGENA